MPRTMRKRLRTQVHIAKTAYELFEKHGYPAVTMDLIATEADVARGTVYNHFPMKEAVLVYWLEMQLADNLEKAGPDLWALGSFSEQIFSLYQASAEWWNHHRQYAAPYLSYRFQTLQLDEPDSSASEMMDLYADLIASAQERGEIGTHAPPPRLSRYLHFLYICALVRWIEDGDTDLADEFRAAFRFFMQGAA